MIKLSRIREYENLHILMWLLKDTCWVLEWKIAGIIMIVPTIAVAIHITWLWRQKISELFHNMAVCLWICANSTWMIGEFYFNDEVRYIPTIFFIGGLLLMFIYYVFLLPQKKPVE